MDDGQKIAHWARSIDPRDAVYWHAKGDTWIGHREDTGFSVSLDDYVKAHSLTTREIERIPSWDKLLETGLFH